MTEKNFQPEIIKLTSDNNYKELLKANEKTLIPLFLITASHKLKVFVETPDFMPVAGDRIIALKQH